MRGGLLPVGVIAAGVGGVLVWTMAAHDPYWRLFAEPSLPAPAYETAAEIEAALASATFAGAAVLAGVPDSAAVRPETGGGREAEPAGVPMALAPRPAEPLIAVPVALGPVAEAGVPVAGEDRMAIPPAPFRTGPFLSEGPLVADVSAPVPVFAAGPPAPLWVPADATSERVLALGRAGRADVQRRLALAGFDPRGFDGVFGPRTRQAIADFQAAWGFPSTGYLDSSMHADLRARTEEAYVALASRAAREPRAAPKLAPLAEERQLASADTGGCARDGNGRILEYQSFGCDLKGLAEKVVSLGRDKLAHEEAGAGPGAVTLAGNASLAGRAGVNR